MAAFKFHHSQHHKLSAPERCKSLPWEGVLEILGPLDGQVIVDIGCGPGYFALPLARAAGSGGRLYAVDTSQEMLDLLKLEITAAKLANARLVLSSESSIPLPDGCCDLIFAAAVYHEFEDRPAMLVEMLRLARRDARHLVIDWNRRSGESGPPLEHRVAEETVIAEYTGAGLSLVRRFEPGADFYGLLFGAQ